MKEQAHDRPEDVVLSLAADVLRSFGELQFRAHGASMLPSIFPGDILIVRRETAHNIRCGDVALVLREGSRLCAHRVIEKTEKDQATFLVTRGDALLTSDPRVGESELLGRVEAVIRGRRRIEMSGAGTWVANPLRWVVRHSDGAAKWLLRWHSLRMFLARNRRAAFARIQPNPSESA